MTVKKRLLTPKRLKAQRDSEGTIPAEDVGVTGCLLYRRRARPTLIG